MPVTNIKRMGLVSMANSTLRCLRTTDYSAGTRKPAVLAAGKPYKYSTGLSSCVKGNIAAGAVVAFLLVGLIVIFSLRKRRQRRANEAVDAADAANAEHDKQAPLPPEADGEHGVHQLQTADKKPELASAKITELAGGGGKSAELGGVAPAELPAG
jgi:hypothetical protein